MPSLRKLQIYRPNGDVVEVEVDESWTCLRAASQIASQFGLPLFEKAWCIGLATEATAKSNVLFWASSNSLVKDLPGTDVVRLLLAELPLKVVRWN